MEWYTIIYMQLFICFYLYTQEQFKMLTLHLHTKFGLNVTSLTYTVLFWPYDSHFKASSANNIRLFMTAMRKMLLNLSLSMDERLLLSYYITIWTTPISIMRQINGI